MVTDFYGAYNAIVCAGKQKCLAHLLGDLKKVAKYKDKSKDWPTFSKRLKRLLRDAMRLCGKRSTLDPPIVGHDLNGTVAGITLPAFKGRMKRIAVYRGGWVP